MSMVEPIGKKNPAHSSLPSLQPPVVVAVGSGLSSEDGDGVRPSFSKQESKQSESSASLISLPQTKQHRRLQQQKQQKQKQNKRHGARNQHRHKFFVKWLVETFDLEKSRAKTAIVSTATIICGDTSNPHKHTSNGESKDDKNNNKNCSKIDDQAIDNNKGTLVSDDENENESCTCQSRNASTSTIIGRPQQQMHILDVAGGKGEVSARLTMCHQQQVIMVDPRPADIVDCYERIVLPKIPNKWQRRLEKQREANPNFVKDIVKARFQQLVTTFDEYKIITDSAYYSAKTTESSSSPNKIEVDSKPPTELQSAVQNATLIVGLHADGATEAIVDAALKYNKPFVVVPCCVFPNFFPMRRILIDDRGDGTSPKLVSVRTHEQFCTYLLQKDPRFVMEELPFEGRNIAIWWDGK